VILRAAAGTGTSLKFEASAGRRSVRLQQGGSSRTILALPPTQANLAYKTQIGTRGDRHRQLPTITAPSTL
jgi:hypothetical protein